jgi:hypothetical protein
MNPSTFYAELVNSIVDYEMRQVARLLSNHVGEQNAITLDALTERVFGLDEDDHVKESDKRKSRMIIETLIEEHGFPVCSHSGKAGRWLAGTQEEALDAAREREGRAAKLLESARKLRAAKLPASMPKFDQQKLQQSLF